ncbi:MAG: single-stranded-DNA-specific exonuclease RecJ [Spirochaetaceae bacterium]|jgi:single-stranded-DNA-specific exonuclease|nr:single-stranded-DNA-specific exonuclease RecJ [Spirochaetaceae bacterium]
MKWLKREINADLVNDISEKYGCDKLTASILVRRSILSGDKIIYFLEDGKRNLHNPFKLSGMEDAVEKILELKEDGGKVLVFGDRDTDGVTSTAILVQCLQKIGIDVSWRVPVGDEPYGLSMQAVEEFAAGYGSLIITVDCGVSNHREIERASELGLDVIVTDHHEVRGEPPPAFAVIDPKIKSPDGGYEYPFPHLAGCAVAYKLTQALDFAQKSSLFNRQVCLLNTRPGNAGSWIIEIKKLRNLVEIDSLTEIVLPGGVSISQTRLPAFLEGQYIYVWDESAQKKNMEVIFGKGVEFGFADIAPQAASIIPSVEGKSLLRLKEVSRLGRYGEPPSELDVFFSVFYAMFQKGEGFFGDEDAAALQLTAIGTLADLMPLENENRILVKHGLLRLNEKAVPGISDLIFSLGIGGGRLDSSDVSWKLTPAINAAGRMGNAALAVELLLEPDLKRRGALALQIVELNAQRRKLTDKAMETAMPIVQQNQADYNGKIVFAASENIPRGVTGLTANRLTSCFNAPAVVVSLAEDVAAGSVRSARGYNLQSFLDQSNDLFIDCGGHDFAAGFSIKMERWNDFVERLKTISLTVEFPKDAEEGGEVLNIDAELPLSWLKPEILSVVDMFQPFGRGNDPLLFLARGLKIMDITLQGRPEVKHVKFTLDGGKHKWPAMYWNAVDKVNVEWTKNDSVDAVFKITRNYFAGNTTPTLIISDLKLSESGGGQALC